MIKKNSRNKNKIRNYSTHSKIYWPGRKSDSWICWLPAEAKWKIKHGFPLIWHKAQCSWRFRLLGHCWLLHQCHFKSYKGLKVTSAPQWGAKSCESEQQKLHRYCMRNIPPSKGNKGTFHLLPVCVGSYIAPVFHFVFQSPITLKTHNETCPHLWSLTWFWGSHGS